MRMRKSRLQRHRMWQKKPVQSFYVQPEHRSSRPRPEKWQCCKTHIQEEQSYSIAFLIIFRAWRSA